MIAILSKRDLEISTEHVMDWLQALGGSFVRLNGMDMLKSVNYNFNEDGIAKTFIPEDVNICWFRRWADDDFIPGIVMNSDSSNLNLLTLQSHLKSETSIISKSFFSSIKGKKWLSSFSEVSTTKIEMLEAALKSGLSIPRSLITTSKNELRVFFDTSEGKVISKCISDGPFFYSQDEFLSLKTVQIDEETLENIPETFFVSLFQQMVEKEYELRVFYLDHTFYAMAIFSQLDGQTTVDFRNYNLRKPNRTVPYTLPLEIVSKLKILMEDLNMSTGSIDLIRATSGEYIFLEVNPVGQFGMTSLPCNYYLEKKVAQYLIANDKRN